MNQTTRCGKCELVQNRRADGKCRRCGNPLPAGTVETTTVVIVDRRARTLKALTEDAAIAAFHRAKTFKGAADILEITTFKLIGILAKIHKTRLVGIDLPKRKPRWTPEKKKTQDAWIAQRKEQGLCIRCGHERDGESIRYCEECLKARRQYMKQRRSGESNETK